MFFSKLVNVPETPEAVQPRGWAGRPGEFLQRQGSERRAENDRPSGELQRSRTSPRSHRGSGEEKHVCVFVNTTLKIWPLLHDLHRPARLFLPAWPPGTSCRWGRVGRGHGASNTERTVLWNRLETEKPLHWSRYCVLHLCIYSNLTDSSDNIRVQTTVFVRPPSEEPMSGDKLHQTLVKRLLLLSCPRIRIFLPYLETRLVCG